MLYLVEFDVIYNNLGIKYNLKFGIDLFGSLYKKINVPFFFNFFKKIKQTFSISKVISPLLTDILKN